MPRFYHSVNDEVEVATKWWSDYPTQFALFNVTDVP